jgi:hypothetical protein
MNPEFIHSSMHKIQYIWTIHLTDNMLFCSLLLCYWLPTLSYKRDWDKHNFYYFRYYKKVKYNNANLYSTYLRVAIDVYTPVQTEYNYQSVFSNDQWQRRAWLYIMSNTLGLGNL